jgi:FkbM family methyltransferase
MTTYAQVGEDIQAAYLLGSDRNITYIDVGCLWPQEHSNTYFFYERGGFGLCIDANPDVAVPFQGARPRDEFVNCGVAATPGSATYIMHDNPVFNTFSPTRATRVRSQAAAGKAGRAEIRRVTVGLRPLRSILEESHFLQKTRGSVDLLSIDVEGFEEEVLKGMDFETVRPRVIVCEYFGRGPDAVNSSQVVDLLRPEGFSVAAFTGHDLFFVDDRA